MKPPEHRALVLTLDKSTFQAVQCANINCLKVTCHFYYFKIIILLFLVFPICHTHLLLCKLKYSEIFLTFTIQITYKNKKKDFSTDETKINKS